MSKFKPGDVVRNRNHKSDQTFTVTEIQGEYLRDEKGVIGAESNYEVVPVAGALVDSVKESNPKDAIGIRKAALSVLPPVVLAETGLALMEGAAKYGRFNYRAVGVRASVYYDATIRHLFAWYEGEDVDPDSGLSHITKAIASLVVLRDAMIRGKCEDDRPPSTAPFYAELNRLAGEVLDRHADKEPKHWTIKDAAQ